MSFFPEDKKVRPGVWFLSWPFKISQCLKAAVDWHDSATSEGSTQEKAGIPGSVVDETFINQIEGCAKETHEYKTVTTWKAIIVAFGRWFTGGRYFK